jgi:DNA-binding NarL/FixJ family response regulator
MMPERVLIVEDVTLVRDVLRLAIAAEASFDGAPTIATWSEAAETALVERPDAVLLGVNGVRLPSLREAIARLRTAVPAVRIVALDAFDAYLREPDEALASGADAYLTSKCGIDEVLSLLRAAGADGVATDDGPITTDAPNASTAESHL